MAFLALLTQAYAYKHAAGEMKLQEAHGEALSN